MQIANSQLHDRSQSRAFALVVTLIMVVLAAVISIGMLTNATLDRTTAKSTNDRYQAEVAVQNGLEAAKKALTASPDATNSLTADDTFLVIRADGTQTNSSGTKDAYYFVAKAKSGNANQVECYPLFSAPEGGAPGALPSTLSIDSTTSTIQKPTAPTNAFSDPAQDTTSSSPKKYPTLLSFQQAPYTQWKEVRDPNDTAAAPNHDLPYLRYTFWIEDLSGYVDASVAGNQSGVGKKHKRADGTNPNEVALFTIFDKSSTLDSGSTLAKNLIENRGLLFTVPTLQQTAPAPTGQTDVTQQNLAVRLTNDSEQVMIPRGYGYAQEGTAKKNLNERLDKLSSGGVTSQSLVSELGSWINTNMPQFKSRGGGMINQDYLDNVSANIIDYADNDTNPTADSGGKYRGIDGYPFLYSLYDLLEWVRTNPPSPPTNPNYTVDVKKTTYVQLWNMSDKQITGTLKLTYSNTDQMKVNTTSGVVIHSCNYDTVSVNLAANEFKAIKMPVSDSSHTKTYTWGPTAPASNAFIQFTPQNDSNTATIYWNNNPVDRTLGGLRHPVTNSTNSIQSGTNCWHGNTAAPVFTAVGAFGDPRASWFLNDLWKSASYDSSSFWGGRPKLTGGSSPFEMKPSAWPDSGHDFQVGKTPSGVTVLPDAVVSSVSQVQTMYPLKLANAGSYASITELGNLFDPAKWTIDGTSFSTANDGGDIPSGASAAPGSSAIPANDADGGGGFTLRIGRREFTKFDQNQKRAWQLLDIFAAGVKTDTIARRSSSGLINVNTASREALRALCANIATNDPAVPAALYPPFNSYQADRFADAVLAGRPFLSEAQLSTIKLDPGYVADPTGSPPGPAPTPFFGTMKQWPTSTRPSELSDAGFEDLFARVYNLASVRSRNFRVFVTGQYVDPRGAAASPRVLSTVNKVFQVFVNPHRDSNGVAQHGQIDVTYEADL